MTKIKISPSLTGTPLTEQELKSIIGGRMGFTRNCDCKLYDDGELVSSVKLEVNDETQCSQKCTNNCNGYAGCDKAVYSYYVTNA